MAATAKVVSSSWVSFLKDALLLPTRNAKLFIPVVLLLAIPSFLLRIINLFCIKPLTAGILHHLNDIKNMDPSSPDYAKLMSEILKEARELVIITIALVILTFVFASSNQIIAFFAVSTTYSGDRYSLPELFSKVILKGRRLIGPLITVAMVTVLNILCMFVLVALVQLVMHHFGVIYVVVLFVLPFLVFLYINVVFVVAAAVSVADTEHRGVSALRQAWQMMTRVWRKQGCVLVVVAHLVALVPSPLYMVAVGYSKKSMPLGLALLFVYALLVGLVELFNFAAAMVYYYQAMESKVVMEHDYVKVPTSEATTV